MAYSLKMFDSKPGVIVVNSTGYASIVTHSHDFVEMGFVTDGQGMGLVEGKYAKLGTGDMFVIADKTVSHSIQPIEDGGEMKLVNVIFPFEYFDLDWSLFQPLAVVPLDKIPYGREILNELQKEYAEKLPYGETRMKSLANLLLTGYLRFVTGRRSASRSGKAAQKLQTAGYIEKAVKYIHENYDRPITVDDVANECGLCKAYLQRIFKKEASTTIKEYIIKYRIEQSCKLLLSTDFSVSMIAEMVGFFNLKYFYLKFKQIVGDSPRNYKTVQEGYGK